MKYNNEEKTMEIIKRNFMEPGITNEEDKLNFIRFWVEYIKTHTDREWSRQQNILINSVIPDLKMAKSKV
ncbi:hypothetical protein HYW74_04850 [Candidatus Pacearchaeota archaeon]|nr:hypothetical protein [Candidatus Pacearchaeota archaeon]